MRRIYYWIEVYQDGLEREIAARSDGAKPGQVPSVAGGGYDMGMLQALAGRGRG